MITIEQFLPMHLPKLSDWVADISGHEWRPLRGEEPNRFHRWMQTRLLGIRWRRV